MKIKKLLPLFLNCLFTLSIQAFGQTTNDGIAIAHDTLTLVQLLKASEQSSPDTNRVKLLNRVSGAYWYHGTKRSIDSCLFYAWEAERLSKTLNYITGHNDAVLLICKASARLNDIRSAKSLLYTVYGEERIRLLMVVAEYYLFDRGLAKTELDKSYPYMLHAKSLSDSVHSTHWRYECLLLIGKYYFRVGNIDKGKNSVMEIINDCKRTGNYKTEARYWSELGLYMPETDTTYKEKINFHLAAYKLYLQQKAVVDAAYSLRDAAELNTTYNQLDTALKQMFQVIAMLRSSGTKITFMTYSDLSDVYYFKGDCKKALIYINKAMDALGPKDENNRVYGYERLADVYERINFFEKALEYNKKTLNILIARNNIGKYYCCYNVVRNQINSGNAKGSLVFLTDFVKNNPTNLPVYQELISASFGNIYNALKEYDKARKYYNEMIRLDEQSQQQRRQEVLPEPYLKSADAYLTMGSFLFERAQYKEAKSFLVRSISTIKSQDLGTVSSTEYLLFKADSALGNFKTALIHFKRYELLKDSIFNQTKTRQITELQVESEIAQREQSIKLLQSQSKNQDADLQKLALQRNVTLTAVILFVLIAALIFSFYRQKQKINLQLQTKQDEINEQNISLQQLLTDKDWLLKEVHHRVKNNLHLISSLLETQSAYLSNNAALEAIVESQSRIQAIALIHQKLYTASNLTVIEMQPYIHELVQYLKNSYNTVQRNINFKLSIGQVVLDVQQAIPIGLILNEAITNSIKHGFNEKMSGEIRIGLTCLEKKELILEIADDGTGLPAGFDFQKSVSMGMTLIKGLSKQLKGDAHIRSEKGTVIEIAFKIEPMASALHEVN